MATKAQIVNYIAEKYETEDKMPVSMQKLDSYKKAELEEFIEKRNDSEELEKWIESTK